MLLIEWVDHAHIHLQPGGQLDRTIAAVDLSSDRLVADVLNTATKGVAGFSGRGGEFSFPFRFGCVHAHNW